MRSATAVLLSLALIGGSAAVGAEAWAKSGGKKKTYRAYRAPAYERRPDYYERYADRLPFGTQIWWEQMDREGRGGRSRGP